MNLHTKPDSQSGTVVHETRWTLDVILRLRLLELSGKSPIEFPDNFQRVATNKL